MHLTCWLVQRRPGSLPVIPTNPITTRLTTHRPLRAPALLLLPPRLVQPPALLHRRAECHGKRCDVVRGAAGEPALVLIHCRQRALQTEAKGMPRRHIIVK